MSGELEELAKLGYRLGVAPIREHGGATNLDSMEAEGIRHLYCEQGLIRAFQLTWPTDAHFCCYHIEHDGQVEESWPRLNKKNAPILAQIRSLGGDVKTHSLVFDFDFHNLPGLDPKEDYPATQELLDLFWDTFFAMPNKVLSWAVKFTYYYCTAHGVRIVYVLTRPIPCDRGEHLHRWLVQSLREAGVLVDRLSDWTRLFRLPRVTRCDEKFPEGRVLVPLEERWQGHLFDPVAVAGPGVLYVPSVQAQRLDYPLPTDEQTWLLVGESDDTRPDWWGAAKDELKHAHCFTTVFGDRVLASEGSRDTTIGTFAREVCRALVRVRAKGWQNVAPGHAYGMLLPAVLQLDTAEQTPDWRPVLWKATLNFWASETAKVEEAKLQAQATILVGMSLSERMLSGMRKWCKAPELESDQNTQLSFLSSRLICGTLGGNFHLMRPDGTYENVPVKTALLKARIRESGLEPVIPLGHTGKDGTWIPYSTARIIDKHATVVMDVEGQSSGPGNWIRGMGGDYPTLVLRLYKRADLQAKFDANVDEWLKRVGGLHWKRLCAWIGHALAFDDGPIAALGLIGPPGIGKKMFAKGLAESISTEAFATTEDMGSYQYGLLRSPFLIVNEGFKKAQGNGYDPADFFRLITGGDPLEVNQKFRDPVKLLAPIRMLVLANNHDVFNSLAGTNRNLTMDDKLAIAQRLVTVKADEASAQWLSLKGGREFTRGWVKGDAGQESNYVLARHFLWLYENRPAVEHGNRFLMQGAPDEGLVAHLSTRQGHAPGVIEILVALIEALVNNRPVEGAVVQRDDQIPGTADSGPCPRVWVTANSVALWARHDQQFRSLERVTHKDVQRIFRGLSRKGEPEKGRVLEWPDSAVMVGTKKGNWFCLDTEILLREAWELGYKCVGLEAIHQEYHKNSQPKPMPAKRGIWKPPHGLDPMIDVRAL